MKSAYFIPTSSRNLRYFEVYIDPPPPNPNPNLTYSSLVDVSVPAQSLTRGHLGPCQKSLIDMPLIFQCWIPFCDFRHLFFCLEYSTAQKSAAPDTFHFYLVCLFLLWFHFSLPPRRVSMVTTWTTLSLITTLSYTPLFQHACSAKLQSIPQSLCLNKPMKNTRLFSI